MLPLPLLLGGCTLLEFVAPPPPPPPPPIRQSLERLPSQADARLVPLPTPQQVVSASTLGRRNPFGPVFVPTIPLPPGVAPGSAAAQVIATVARAGGDGAAQLAAAQATLRSEAAAAAAKAASGTPGAAGSALQATLWQSPTSLRLTGVIQASGHTEAVVAYGSQSGSLRVGDLGGRTTALLPAGWAVVAIHLGGHGQEDVPSLVLQKGKQRLRYKL